MIVPQYWAESRVQRRENRRQVTVRRFGWSDESQEAAQRHADQRAQEALNRIWHGEKLARRERKLAYNGAQGVPIREEILNRYGDAIVTRNAYGARCLNTPNVLFVDVDDASQPSATLTCALILLMLAFAAAWGWYAESICFGVMLALLGWIGAYFVAEMVHRSMQLVQGDFETRMRRRIAEFLEARREWNLRLYRTPAGLRVLVTHKTFAPDDPAVAECFAALGADPLYVRMCLNQHCFRARVSPKPWRIGVSDHIPPGRGTWPIRPEIAEDRADWVEKYEAEATRFAACRFLESTGSGVVHHQVRWVQELHDDLCYATSGLPIA